MTAGGRDRDLPEHSQAHGSEEQETQPEIAPAGAFGPASARTLGARGPILLGAGLFGALIWSGLTSFAKPNSFDPSEACELKYQLQEGRVVGVDDRFFPPGASCRFSSPSGQTVTLDYMSPGVSRFLTTLAVGLVLMILAGAVLTTWRLVTGLASARTPPVRLNSRRWAHVGAHLGGLFVGGLATMWFGPYCAQLAILFGDWAGVIAMAALIIFAVGWTSVRLDVRLGPYRGDREGSLRRGVLVALIGCGSGTVAIVGGARTGAVKVFPLPEKPPLGPVWLTVAVALVFVAVAAAQWAGSTRSR